MIYYVDPENGKSENNGVCMSSPLLSVEDRNFEPGDKVLFKRGTVIRSELQLNDGNETGSITYGAYGEGANPVVNPSVRADLPAQWREDSPGIWYFTDPIPSEMCNIVFNDGESFGNLRWSKKDLKHTGEWTYGHLGYSMYYEEPENKDSRLYLVCDTNPASYYRSIELVVWGKRQAVTVQQYAVIENLTFEKCGVHGFSATNANSVHIRNCKFRCIGGGVFDRSQKVRLGNAVEFWNGAVDCSVENCIFEDIYDSGITHQGNEQSELPERLVFRRNTFRRCGLAAYEWRGPLSKDIVFEDNYCEEAGGAFTMQGEASPRRTETLEPICACAFVLIWLKARDLPDGQICCTIRNNKFNAASGCEAIIVSTLDNSAYRQFVIDHNQYIGISRKPLAYIRGKKYYFRDFEAYQADTDKDQNSSFSTVDQNANICADKLLYVGNAT